MKNQPMTLPQGYTAEPFTIEQAAAVVDMLNAHSLQTLGIKSENLEDDMAFWKTPGFDLEKDTQVIRDPQGQVVAYAEFWDLADPHTRYNIFGAVHPQHEGRGIGSFLLRWFDERAQASLPKAPSSAQVILAHGIDSRLQGAARMLEEHGYQLTRRYYHMHIELDHPIPEPEIPAGMTIRAALTETDQRRMLHALWESFHDHWGYIEEPVEEHYKRFMSWAKNMKDWDPSIWYIAEQDGEIAGACLNSMRRPEDPEMGWVNQLGVRRAYRKQGLGLALLRIAFREFAQRGKKRVGLGVDTGSLTGALKLYETAGMHPAREMHSYFKVVRQGVDLATQEVSAVANSGS
jgi:mycothiol synthase